MRKLVHRAMNRFGECEHYEHVDEADRFMIRHSVVEELRDCEEAYYCCGHCKTILIARFYEMFTLYLNGEEADIRECPAGHKFLSFAQFYEPAKE